MKKTKTVRFNETADVYQSTPIRIKDAEDIIATQPVKSTEDSKVTKPATSREDSKVTEPATSREDSKVTEPATSREDSKVTEPVVKIHSEETVLARQLVKYAIAAAVKSLEEDNYIIKSVKWITHGAFTTEKCRRQIDQFVSSWEYEDRWVHYTKLNETRDLGHSFHYIYAVRWSAPTAQSPLALASTYTFFTVKFNKNKPPYKLTYSVWNLKYTKEVKYVELLLLLVIYISPSALLITGQFKDQKVRLMEDAPVDVSYCFERQLLIHRPGMSRFREIWAKVMVEGKDEMMESLPF